MHTRLIQEINKSRVKLMTEMKRQVESSGSWFKLIEFCRVVLMIVGAFDDPARYNTRPFYPCCMRLSDANIRI